jgi:hypothetical protein
MAPKPRLVELLTAGEVEALKKRGFRAVTAMKPPRAAGGAGTPSPPAR